MHARCTGKLCQTTDRILNIIGSYHHQICQLVYDNDDLWHFLRFVLSRKILNGLYLLIITFHISDTVLLEGLITFHHFRNCPVKCTGCFLRIRYNRNQQMRYSIVHAQLYYFRIDHDQFYFVRFCFVQNTHNDRIDTYRLTGTGSTCDQQMRHLGNICHNDMTCDIFSCTE